MFDIDHHDKSGVDPLRHTIAKEAVERNREQAETVVIGEGDTDTAIYCLKIETDGAMLYDGEHRQYAYQGETEAIVEIFETIVDTKLEEATDNAPINWERGALAERDVVELNIETVEQTQ